MNFSDQQLLTKEKLELVNYLPEIGIDSLRNEIIEGLLADQKYISSKFFYDKAGSQLFEDITHLEAYYPTRTEKKIIKIIAPSLGKYIHHMDLVELGSGDCSKISLLLDGIPALNRETITYVPVDFSQSALRQSAEELRVKFPGISVFGIVADFFHMLDFLKRDNPKTILFFGSTIGNFTPTQAQKFVADIGRHMHAGDQFILGMDMVKDITILENAYNDKEGVTAAFNKNILKVANQLIESNFNVTDFEHKAFFNPDKSRIEMHLVATRKIEISSPHHNHSLNFEKGESIHTENSYKFTQKDIAQFTQLSSLKLMNCFPDERGYFSLCVFRKE